LQALHPVRSRTVQSMEICRQIKYFALFHLRQDDWITSQRSGRTSLHALFEHGRAETQQANRRMYTAPTICSAH
jgi:phenylacetic acid degradation operon negative regulatory protein